MATVTPSSLDYATFDKEIGDDPLGLMIRMREEGTVCAVPVDDGQRLLVVAEPAVAAAALAHGTRNHRGLLRELVGSGLFVVASGERWRQRRGLLRPCSHRAPSLNCTPWSWTPPRTSSSANCFPAPVRSSTSPTPSSA